MYPSASSYGGYPPPPTGGAPPPPPSSSSGRPPLATHAQVSTPALQSVSSSSVSSVRVTLLEDFWIGPPVVIPPSLTPSASSVQLAPLDLSLERRLIEEGAASSDVRKFVQEAEMPLLLDNETRQYCSAGMSRAAVSLGVAHCAVVRQPKDKALEYANNYSTLIEMGFSPALAAGALVKHRNDLAAATDTLAGLA